ncbi:hypothetical protein [Microbacterium aurum]
MVDRSAALTEALRLIDASVEAYRVLLRDNPQDYFEAADRQQEAAGILDEAQTLSGVLSGDEVRTFGERFADAYAEIGILETKRIQGGGEDFEDDDPEDNPEARLNERIIRYFPYLAHEFKEAGRSDLGDRLLASYQQYGLAAPAPTDLSEILAVGIELRLGTALSADREWRIADFIRSNPALLEAEDSAHRIDRLLDLQRTFRDAKRRGDVEQMRHAQADFESTVRDLGTEFNLMGLLAMLATFDPGVEDEE